MPQKRKKVKGMFYAGFKEGTGLEDIAAFKTKYDRDKWVSCSGIKGMETEIKEQHPELLMRQPLTEDEVVQRFGLDNIGEVETLDSYFEEFEQVTMLVAW